MDVSVDHVERLAYGIFSPVPPLEIASDIRFLKRTAPSRARNPGLRTTPKVRHKEFGGTLVLVQARFHQRGTAQRFVPVQVQAR